MRLTTRQRCSPAVMGMQSSEAFEGNLTRPTTSEAHAYSGCAPPRCSAGGRYHSIVGVVTRQVGFGWVRYDALVRRTQSVTARRCGNLISDRTSTARNLEPRSRSRGTSFSCSLALYDAGHAEAAGHSSGLHPGRQTSQRVRDSGPLGPSQCRLHEARHRKKVRGCMPTPATPGTSGDYNTRGNRRVNQRARWRHRHRPGHQARPRNWSGVGIARVRTTTFLDVALRPGPSAQTAERCRLLLRRKH